MEFSEPDRLTLNLASEADTGALGRALAGLARPGLVVGLLPLEERAKLTQPARFVLPPKAAERMAALSASRPSPEFFGAVNVQLALPVRVVIVRPTGVAL